MTSSSPGSILLKEPWTHWRDSRLTTLMWSSVTDQTTRLPYWRPARPWVGSLTRDGPSTGVPQNGQLTESQRLLRYVKEKTSTSPLLNSASTTCSPETTWRRTIEDCSQRNTMAPPSGLLWLEASLLASTTMVTSLKEVDTISRRHWTESGLPIWDPQRKT